MRAIADHLLRLLDLWRGKQGLARPDVATAFRPEDGKILLHVGCGPEHLKRSGGAFQGDEWREVRLDINPGVAPDIVASMLDLGPVASESVDAVFSSHNIEHLYPHEVPVALGEFNRVLKPAGFLLLTCPDLHSICKYIIDAGADATAYVSAAGPIAPVDMLYGHRPQLAAGNLFMAHRYGFTLETLTAHLRNAGFSSVIGMRRESAFDLWCLASKHPAAEDRLREAAATYFPR